MPKYYEGTKRERRRRSRVVEQLQGNKNQSETNFSPSSSSFLRPFDRGNRIFERRKSVERAADACRRGSSGRIDTFRRYSTSNIGVAPFSITRPRDKAFLLHTIPPSPSSSTITDRRMHSSFRVPLPHTHTHTRLILAPLCPALLYLSISSGVSGSSRAAINLLESLINRLMLDPLNGGQCLSTRNCPCPQQCTCLEIGWPVFRRIVAGMGGGIWGEVDGAVCS